MKGLKFIGVCAAVMAALSIAHLIGNAAYDRPDDFTKPEQLNRQDCRVGVLAGYDSERLSRREFPRAQIVGFKEFDDAFMALLAGKIEAFVYNEHVLNVALRAYPNRLKMLDDPIARSAGVVLVSEKRPDLLPKLNSFIKNYRRSGYYDDMFTRWCQSDVFVPMPEIPVDGTTTNVLRIGTSGTEEPSSFYNDAGELVGFDIEFIKRFAQVQHLRPQIVCRPDETILKELADGDLDIVIDDYNANEVEVGLLASDAYFDSDVRVLVRNGDSSGMMLGSTRLGFSKTLIKDPRVRLFTTGFFTTLALTTLSAIFGFLCAWVLRLIVRHSPAFLKSALDGLLEVVRLLPPPVVILTFSCAILTSASMWTVAVAAFSFWFAAFLVPAGDGVRAWLPVSRVKLVELMQWTSVVGSVSVCDLTMAADLVCGRTLAAFGPLLSVAAAYCLMNWIVDRAVAFIERKLA